MANNSLSGLFDKKKLENNLKDGLTRILIDERGEKALSGMEKLMDKMYKTATTPRHKARKNEPVGSFSQYGVPVDTGNLQRSIKKLPIIKSGGHVIGQIIQDSSIAPYGKSIEYGHGIRPPGSKFKGKKRGGYIGWVPPQSFMRSTLYKHKPDIQKLLKSG